MRRVIGLILAGLGTFLIVCAVLLPTWVSGTVVKFPLNEYETATLAARNATYFSASTLTEKTGVNMQATYTIKGDGAAGNSSTAVWNEYSYVYDLTNRQAVQQATRRFAFDRRTAQLVDCCGVNVNGNTAIRQTGLLGYVFPIGTKKQTYDVFDTTLNKPVPFTYAGTADVHGIQAYVFVENVAPVQIATQAVPGSIVGVSAATVTLPVYYQIHLIYYVDPATGALIDVNEHQTVALHNPATGSQALLLFDADLIATPATVTSVVALDSSGRNELSLLETTLPLVLGIAGAVALIAGVLLARKPREEAEPAGTSPGSAADAAVTAEAAPAADTPAGRSVVPGLDDEPAEATAQPAEAEAQPAEATAKPPEAGASGG
jgi:Porin PorA